MLMDEDGLKNKILADIEKIKAEVKKPNILLVGGTGVGKSTLINMIFGEDLAKTGTGKPLTSRIDIFENPTCDVRLFDSKGYEIGEEEEFKKEVLEFAKRVSDPTKQIHLVWYCINSASHRVTDYDLNAIRFLTENEIKTAIILTKADCITDEEAKNLRDSLAVMRNVAIFETSTNNSFSHHKELVDWSIEALPEELKTAFIKSQRVNLSAKWNKAHAIIAGHSAASFGVGFTPLPMSDAPLLIANQSLMIANILNVYDLGGLSNFFRGAGLEVIIGPLISNLGKSLAVSLLKLIPGVGTVIGGIISGTVGATLTLALGEAFSTACYGIWQAMLQGKNEESKRLLENFASTVETLTRQYNQAKMKAEDAKEPK